MIDDVTGHYEVTSSALSVERESARVADPGHGAIASFVGVVRNHAGAERTGVTSIYYEAFAEMAEKKMAEIGAALLSRHAQGKRMRISIVHRVGELVVGDASVVIAIGCERRKESLAACAEAIERLKENVPVWKKERFRDGSEWVGWAGDPPSTHPKR